MLQELAEPLEVPFQLTYVHRGIVGGLVRGIWGEGRTDPPKAVEWGSTHSTQATLITLSITPPVTLTASVPILQNRKLRLQVVG